MKKPFLIATSLLFLFVTGAKAQSTNPPDLPDLDIKEKVDSSKVNSEKVPEFPGGIDKFMDYLNKNLKYANDTGRPGTILVQFVVNTDGRLVEAKILSGMSTSVDLNVIQLILGSPKWKPGIQNGKPIKVRYRMPINLQ